MHKLMLSSYTGPCEVGWTPYDGACYYYSRQRHNYTMSEASCEALGAYLVEIQDINERNFLAYLM